MTKQRSTKRAMLVSGLALLLCVSMFIGTTFAWFTDSVTSGNNKIVAGNLDIELEYYNGTEWKTVNNATDLFTGNLWEPGHTEVVYLKLSNLGSLALKYQLGINIVSETEGITVDENGNDKTFKLSDYIYMGVVEDQQPSFANREDAVAAVDGAGIISTGYTKTGNMTADAAALYLAVVVYMPETVGNEANHKTGTDAPEINLGINLVATQLNFEEDSFGPDYDEGLNPVISYVSSYEDLKKALEKGGTVELLSDISIPASEMNTDVASTPVAIAITGGKNVVLDLNGNTITTEAESGNVATLFVHDSTLTITGEGEINQNADGFIVWAKGESTVNVEGGTFNGGADETSVFYASSNVAYDPASGYATINVYGGNFDSDSKDNPADRLNIANVMNHGAGRINYYGGTFGWNPTELVSADDKNYVTVADGYKVVETSGKFVVVPENVDNVILTADDLAALSGTSINGIYMLMADIDMTGYEMKPIMLTSGANSELTFDGNGHTISNLTYTQAYQNGMWVSGLFNIMYSGKALNVNDLTLANVNSTSNKYAAALVAYNSTSLVITLNNVDVNGATVSAETVAALVGYTTGAVNLTDCDVSGLSLTGEEAAKMGAYVGTANTATCVVTVRDCTNTTAYNDAGRVINGATWDGVIGVNSAEALQKALNEATDNTTIVLRTDITGDVTVPQKPDVKITVDGNGKTFAGVLLVDGKSGTYITAGLTVKELVFKADSISADACIQLGKDNNTRYTCNVTISGCTFDVPGAVGIKSYTGGDKNLTIIGCDATADAHSLAQLKGIDGVLIEACEVYSKNGINLNNSDNVVIKGCTADVKGYAVRFGESSGGSGAAETYLIENCSLKSACDDGDAVIVLRGTADYSTLTIKSTTLEGTIEITNTATGATVNR